MRQPLFLIILFASLFVTSCSTTGKSDRDGYAKTGMDTNTVEVNAAETGLDLTAYLRRIPGVMVRGNGQAATVRVRGDVSFQANTSPLFVVNGTPLGQDYAKIFSTIDVNEIQRVRVLKTTSETNRYGMQGGSGVIEIKLK